MINAHKIVDFYYESKPTVCWEMSEDVFEKTKDLKDDNSQYLYTIKNKEHHLLNIPIKIVQGVQFLSLRYSFIENNQRLTKKNIFNKYD